MINNIENTGQTTLFKINTKTNKNECFFRFKFIISLQYLNEKEEFLTDIFIKNNKVANMRINSLKIKPGKVKEVKLGSVDEAYEIAKNKVRETLKKKREYVRAINFLNKKLKR